MANYLVPLNIKSPTSPSYKIIFSDVNLFADIQPNGLVVNADSIQQSFMFIAACPLKQRWWRFDFGSTLGKLLFDPMDEITAGKIQTDLFSAYRTWQPRAVINTVEVIPNYDDQTYYVEINYDVPELRKNGIVFSFSLAKSAN